MLIICSGPTISSPGNSHGGIFSTEHTPSLVFAENRSHF